MRKDICFAERIGEGRRESNFEANVFSGIFSRVCVWMSFSACHYAAERGEAVILRRLLTATSHSALAVDIDGVGFEKCV